MPRVHHANTARTAGQPLLTLGVLLIGCAAPPAEDSNTVGSLDTAGDTGVTDCEPGLKVEQCLPDFSLIGPDGELLTLASCRGDVVIYLQRSHVVRRLSIPGSGMASTLTTATGDQGVTVISVLESNAEGALPQAADAAA